MEFQVIFNQFESFPYWFSKKIEMVLNFFCEFFISLERNVSDDLDDNKNVNYIIFDIPKLYLGLMTDDSHDVILFYQKSLFRSDDRRFTRCYFLLP